jgi:TRAP-type C4-dicarboxylate transport system permease small subunit
MRIIRLLSDGLGKVLDALIVLFIVTMTVFMTAQVAGRYLFGTGLYWAEELSRFSMVFMVYTGAALASRHQDHIRVTILDELLKGVWYRIYRTIIALITIGFIVIVSVIGFRTLPVLAQQTSPNMGVSMHFIYAILPVGLTVMTAYEILTIVGLFVRSEARNA